MGQVFGLEGKTCIIWGGGRGMGERSAMHLAQSGCNIAIVDMDAERGQQVADAVAAIGRRSVALQADVTVRGDVERAVLAAEEALGPLDISVMVVGLAVFKPLLEMSDAEWDDDLNVNLKAFFMTSQAVARSIMGGGRTGSIVAISSVSGLTTAPVHGAYGAAKAGMINLVRTMAAEWGPAIRVNAIAPGVTETIQVPASPEVLATVSKRIPMKRMCSTDEIGKAVLFMASDLASFVTGQTLAVDGGWTAAYLMSPDGELKHPELQARASDNA